MPKPWIAPGRPFAGLYPASGGVASVDLTAFGTLTRSTEGSYQTSASAVAWASSNVMRMEDTGDGNGSMVLLEGSSANLEIRSQQLETYSGGSGSTTGSIAAPDGTSTAARFQTSGGQYRNPLNPSPLSGWLTHSIWQRAYTSASPLGTWTWVPGIGTGGVCDTSTSATSYSRSVQTANRGGSSGTFLPHLADSTDRTGFGGLTAGSRDAVYWGCQVENMPFATSHIRTTGASATRGADIFTATIAATPTYIVNGAFTFDVAPVFSSNGAINLAADQCIFSYAEDDSERICWYVTGGSLYIRVVSGGVEKVKSNALTFSAAQKLTVTVRAGAGSIGVSGATTGNGVVTGTSWTRTTGPTLYIGNRQGATQPAYMRLGRYIYAA